MPRNETLRSENLTDDLSWIAGRVDEVLPENPSGDGELDTAAMKRSSGELQHAMQVKALRATIIKSIIGFSPKKHAKASNFPRPSLGPRRGICSVAYRMAFLHTMPGHKWEFSTHSFALDVPYPDTDPSNSASKGLQSLALSTCFPGRST